MKLTTGCNNHLCYGSNVSDGELIGTMYVKVARKRATIISTKTGLFRKLEVDYRITG